MKEPWNLTDADVENCLKATTWYPADRDYFRGGGFSSNFLSKGGMPVTMMRLNHALNIRPVFEAEEVASDVEEVSVVEETPRVGQPLRPQPLRPEPQAPKGGKGKLVLGAAAALVALACAYFFLTPKEEMLKN